MIKYPSECILFPDQYRLIWKFSWLSLLSIYYAYTHAYSKNSYLLFISSTIFLTSLNYWRFPVINSMRRYMDIFCVLFGITYQINYASIYLPLQYCRIYFTLLSISLSFYPLSRYCHSLNFLWFSTYLHCLLHLFGNISNIFLYSHLPDGL